MNHVLLPRSAELGGMFGWSTGAARTVLALDLGQRRDPTAAAVVDSAEMVTGFDHAQWRRITEKQVGVRFLERMPLGTPYPDVVERTRDLLGRLWADSPALVVDATGVGVPVVDMLRRAGLGCMLVPVMITAGDRARFDGGYWKVPKRDLISGLQLMLEQKRLRVAARIREASTFLQELQNMQVKTGLDGRTQFGAWREGTHDDLVLAVALAHWWLARAAAPVHGARNLVYPLSR